MGCGAKHSKFLIMAWSFQLPALNQEPSRSPLRVTSLEQKTLLLLRELQGLQEPGSNIKYYKKRCSSGFYHLGNSNGFRISFSWIGSSDLYVFSMYSHRLYIYIYFLIELIMSKLPKNKGPGTDGLVHWLILPNI